MVTLSARASSQTTVCSERTKLALAIGLLVKLESPLLGRPHGYSWQ